MAAATLNDLMYQYFSGSGVAGSNAVMPVVSASPGIESTLRSYATAAAPAAAANIASVTTANAGLYLVHIETFIGGTTVSDVECQNMRFKVNSVATASTDILLTPVPSTTGAVALGVHDFLKQCAAGDILRVSAGATSTVGSIYYVMIHATRVSI